MLHPNDIEHRLRLDTLRQRLRLLCQSDIARQLTDEMRFVSDYATLSGLLRETDEMLVVSRSGLDFPRADLADPRPALARTHVEGLALTEAELLAVRRTIHLAIRTEEWLAARPPEDYPALRQASAELLPFPLLLEVIDRVLDADGAVRDEATPELASIRRSLRTEQQRQTRVMAEALRRAKQQQLVAPDAEVTVRDGVPLLPVPAANKRLVDGLVVDLSSSGQTAFVEPAEMLALKSRLAALRNDERQEVHRILRDTTDHVRPYAQPVARDAELLGHLDFLAAKAQMAIAMRAIVPRFENRQGMYLSAARHPLLEEQLAANGKQIVPLTLELEAPQARLLIISGPNAGGKSVCLQTVALLQLMLQHALPIPAQEGTAMGIFQSILIDIGDNQSLDNDLSTYSAHLQAMKTFVRAASPRSLILIDEFGTGTEPQLGGAIAESVLQELNDQGAYGVLTTHYTNLKHFAQSTPGLANAAMAFDTARIEPLFSLHMGQPGSSFAFEIAHKIGLPARLIERAREKAGNANADYDRNLRQISRDKHYYEEKREQIKAQERRLADLEAQLEASLSGVKAERRQILDRAREEASAMLADTNRTIENTIRRIVESQAQKEPTRQARRELDDYKSRVAGPADDTEQDDLQRRIDQLRRRQERRKKDRATQGDSQQQSAAPEPAADTPLAPGDYATLDGDESRTCQVLSLDGNKARVALGAMKATVETARLRRVSGTAARKLQRQATVAAGQANYSDNVRERKLTFHPEIDLRGQRCEAALAATADFLDEAVLCGAQHVRILHGKGTGVLREEIRRLLANHASVADARDEEENLGGAGVTLVTLK